MRQPRDPGALGPMPSLRIQELWFASVRRQWQTLALVPAQEGKSILPLARALATVGQFHRAAPLRVIDVTGMGLDEIADLTLGAMSSHERNEGGRILVLEPISTNPFGTAIAMTSDAVILCVELGVTDMEEARRALDQIGRERFVGTAIIE